MHKAYFGSEYILLETFIKSFCLFFVMGFKDLINAMILKRNIKKAKKTSAVERNIDILLADEMKTMTSTNRTIDKLLKIKLMRQETQHTLGKIDNLDAERYDDEEEDDNAEKDSFEDEIKKMLMSKLLGGVTPPPQEDYVEPAPQVAGQSQNPIFDAVNNMTPVEMNKLKSKFLQ